MKNHLILASLLATSMFISVTGKAQVTGRNVTFVEIPDGSFALNTDGTWKQRTHANIFDLRETKRDESSVYLFDATRNTSIQLDITKKEVYTATDKSEKTKLCDVTKILEGPVGYTRCSLDNMTFTTNDLVDVAYGADGKFKYKTHVSGTIKFDAKTFGDPAPGVEKVGYYKIVTNPSRVGSGN